MSTDSGQIQNLKTNECLSRRDRAEAAEALRHEWPLGLVLGKLGLRRSTYYYLRSHPREDAYADVRRLVREIFSRTPNGMGYRQVRMALRREQGLAISGKTVLRLMREEGCRCRIRRSRYDSYEGEVGKVAGNVLNREFKAGGPMERLATDVTEFAVAGGKAYLSPVMDMVSNEIVAWSVSTRPDMAQIMEMMEGLEARDLGQDPLLHSDQGWQYQHRWFQGKLAEMGITQSMSRKATCLDNACMEGFFGHLKDEFYEGQEYGSFEEFKAKLDTYIGYWNTQRRQLALNEMTSVEYRGHQTRAA